MTLRPNERLQLLRLHIEHLTDGKGVVLLKSVLFQLLQQLSHAVDMLYHLGAHGQAVGTVGRIVRKRRIFFDVDDGIDSTHQLIRS